MEILTPAPPPQEALWLPEWVGPVGYRKGCGVKNSAMLWAQRPGRENVRRAELSAGCWREVLRPRTGETHPTNTYQAPATHQEGPNGETCGCPKQAINFMSPQSDIFFLLSVQFECSGIGLCLEEEGHGRRRGSPLAILYLP